MDIWTRLKYFFLNTDTSKKYASVFFYPKQIIVQTFDFADTGIGLGSNKLSKLSFDVSPEILGQTLRYHFALTEYEIKYKRIGKTRWEDYKKAAGFKTNKETYKDARRVGCSLTDSEIILYPNANKHNTGYFPVPNSEIKLPVIISDTELGIHLLKARDISIA